MTITALHPVAPGEPAPHFALPAVDGPEIVSLDDYRGRSALFLALMVGLWCPFCRRQLVQLGALDGKLKSIDVQTLAVVTTAAENARLYFRFRPTPLKLASDPELRTHGAYGVPKPELTPAVLAAMDSTLVNPTGELPAPLPVSRIGQALDERDGYSMTADDRRDVEHQFPQLKGYFLIDRDAIVRWAHIECGNEGLAGVGKFPSEEEILAAARACAR